MSDQNTGDDSQARPTVTWTQEQLDAQWFQGLEEWHQLHRQAIRRNQAVAHQGTAQGTYRREHRFRPQPTVVGHNAVPFPFHGQHAHAYPDHGPAHAHSASEAQQSRSDYLLQDYQIGASAPTPFLPTPDTFTASSPSFGGDFSHQTSPTFQGQALEYPDETLIIGQTGPVDTNGFFDTLTPINNPQTMAPPPTPKIPTRATPKPRKARTTRQIAHPRGSLKGLSPEEVREELKRRNKMSQRGLRARKEKLIADLTVERDSLDAELRNIRAEMEEAKQMAETWKGRALQRGWREEDEK